MDSISVSREPEAPRQYTSAKKRGDRSGHSARRYRSARIRARALDEGPSGTLRVVVGGPEVAVGARHVTRCFSGDPGSLKRPKIPQPCKDSGQRQDVNSKRE